MMMWRALHPQGILGIAAALALAMMVIVAKLDARHWSRQSERFENLYRAEASARTRQELGMRKAREEARANDLANLARVRELQTAINRRSSDELSRRLAAARAASERLRADDQPGANSRRRRAATVSGIPLAPAGTDTTTSQDRFSFADRLIATEQAIQLDELIRWVRAQSAVQIDSDNRPADGARKDQKRKDAVTPRL